MLGEVPEWVPVRLGEVGPFRCAEEVAAYREDVERAARAQELQPLVWPDPFPADSEFAMLVATYAKQIGRAVAFSLAAFRQAFAAGRDLSERDNVLIAAAACEMHPLALIKGAELRGTRAAARGRDRGGGRRRRARRPGGRDRRRRGDRGAAVKANRAYELIVRRGGRGPALLRSADEVDHVEVVEIDSGEVVLFWDTTPAQTGRLSRALKADLAGLDADEFLARWRRYDSPCLTRAAHAGDSRHGFEQ